MNKRKLFGDTNPTDTKPKNTDGSVPINFRKYLASAYEVFEAQSLLRIDDNQMKTHLGDMLDTCKTKRVAEGDKLMIKMRKMLDYIPKTYKDWTRSKMQKDFHRNFLQAVCLHLYKNDPDADLDRVMRLNKFTNLKQQVLCLTPRRFGKSTCVAMFIASYALSIPNSEQCVFSTGRRASQKLLELIRDMIKGGEHAHRIIKCNQETMLIQGDSPLDIRKVHSYPSASKTLRGCGGDVVYMEEAAFMSLDVFFEVIVPLL